ncbi:serine hydrolase [Phycicoccus avicenniae]|uniref:serine hydrolase n=1 Tax=Phycicoccus avicenniae TaxID=2828860 RepID=UPI003D2D7496
MPPAPGPSLPSTSGARWSVAMVGTRDGAVLVEHGPDLLLPSASVAKVFLLVEVAARLVDGRLDPALLLDRRAVAPVADSGLWRHLATDALPVLDLAVLVGSVSDNLATNVLLDAVGLEAVRARAATLAPGGSTLHDRVRDERGAGDPALLGEACARDLVDLFAGLGAGRVVGPQVSALVLHWVAANTDHSQVSRGLLLDPLAHDVPDHGVSVWSKTGTDAGVRAEAGLARGPRGSVAFAALCAWEPGVDDAARGEVLGAMAGLGTLLRGAVGTRPARR